MDDGRVRQGSFRALRRGLSVLLGVLLGVLGAATPGPVAAAGTPVIALVRIAGGHTFDQPVFLTNAGDGRLFVVERPGRLRIVKNGAVVSTPFLDISGRVRSSYQEEGLLGLAFHPGYPADPRFYVAYTKSDLSLQVSSFRVGANADVASATETPILNVPHPTNQNHNGGMIAFGPDGYLYIGTGDGGSGGDPPNNAQNQNILLGKLLRIDVDHPSGGRAYGIPATNPYVGIAGRRPEIWAYGLRNPWRWSFDRATHDLWIGDVGQNAYEEVDRATAGSGLDKAANYGWSCREGFHAYNASRCPSSGLTNPYAEYAHGSGDSVGCAVTGGYVYRGATYPTLQGRYVMGDYCTGRILGSSGEWGIAPDPASAPRHGLANQLIRGGCRGRVVRGRSGWRCVSPDGERYPYRRPGPLRDVGGGRGHVPERRDRVHRQRRGVPRCPCRRSRRGSPRRAPAARAARRHPLERGQPAPAPASCHDRHPGRDRSG